MVARWYLSDTIWVAPDTDTWYTAIIHDQCEVQDTVQQLVTVLPAPSLSPGPFEGCYEVEANAGSGYASYVWVTDRPDSSPPLTAVAPIM